MKIKNIRQALLYTIIMLIISVLTVFVSSSVFGGKLMNVIMIINLAFCVFIYIITLILKKSLKHTWYINLFTAAAMLNILTMILSLKGMVDESCAANLVKYFARLIIGGDLIVGMIIFAIIVLVIAATAFFSLHKLIKILKIYYRDNNIEEKDFNPIYVIMHLLYATEIILLLFIAVGIAINAVLSNNNNFADFVSNDLLATIGSGVTFAVTTLLLTISASVSVTSNKINES